MNGSFVYASYVLNVALLCLLGITYLRLNTWDSVAATKRGLIDLETRGEERYFHTCDRSLFPSNWTNQELRTHKFTSRGLELQYVDLLAEGRRNPRMEFLELGTGLGRLIVELQTAFPLARCTGTNYFDDKLWGRQFPLSRSPFDLIAVASHYNISLACDQAGVPRLPSILSLNVGIQNNQFDLYVPHQSYDIVLSLHALNNKFPAKYAHFAILRVLRLMKPTNSFAHLHFSTVERESPSYSLLCVPDKPQVLWFRTISVRRQTNHVAVFTHKRYAFCAVFLLWARDFLPAQFKHLSALSERHLKAEEFVGKNTSTPSARQLPDHWARIQDVLLHLEQWTHNSSLLDHFGSDAL